MSYEITITETRRVVRKVGREWAVIGSREVERDSTFYSSDPNEPKTRIEEVRGYTPEIEKDVTETREVLKQTVDELDLPSVIKAINKI